MSAVNEKQPGDVLVMPSWAGNRPMRGPASGRDYGRVGKPKRLWMDPRDVDRMPSLFKRIESPLPHQTGRGGVDAIEQYLAARGIVQVPVETPALPHTGAGDVEAALARYGHPALKVSIVTGTLNRLPLLQHFVESCRASLPESMDVELIVVDNGSTDGTAEWLAGQEDVTLIQMGEPVGGMRAFTEGLHRVADDTDYVLVGNDDVHLVGDSLLRALVHLETHPDCGIVAFEHDRRAPGSGQWGTEQAPARTEDGQRIRAVYAQTALVRKWLGDEIGWWGGDGPLADVWTYGGDNYLSARCWELGYRIDVLPGVRAGEVMPMDAVREEGVRQQPASRDRYHELWPDGHLVRETPQLPNPQRERMRVLYLAYYDTGIRPGTQRRQKRGLRNGLKAKSWVYELDFMRLLQQPDREQRLAGLVEAFRPHVIFLQMQRPNRTMVDLLQRLRERTPAVFFNFCGDYWPEKHLDPNMLALLDAFDLALTVNGSMVDEYEARGIQAAYLPQAAEERMSDEPVPAHDVLYTGTNYSAAREALGRLLVSLPVDVGLYGANWPEGWARGITHYDYGHTAALAAAAKIVISDNQFTPRNGHPQAYAYTGNRLWEALWAGGFVLQQRVEGLDEETGLVAGKHYVAFDEIDELPDLIASWLLRDEEREAIAKRGRAYVRRWHSWTRRVEWIFERYLPEVAGA